MAKKRKLSEGALRVLEILKENGGDMSFAQIKQVWDGANTSHLGVLAREGYVAKDVKPITETIVKTVEKTVYAFEKDLESEGE